MSREIDERIVEMRFDNQHFEKNVQTSMSTLDKFKQKLQFKDASKGFDNIDRAAKKTDLSPLANAADKVGLRFSALYTTADQALRNITNSAMAAGKRIVDALTIDPVKTGLQEYETKINAVQVIKANTRGKFKSEAEQMDVINNALAELNDYADRTIYNFAQMTDNVGKFVAQTGDVEKSVKAVQGLANLAGASGASAQDMARATYQMSQALGGTIRKIDWNSLRNANMAGQELKNMLIDLAKVEGVDIDGLIAEKGTFEDTLEKGWLTGDLFMKAMNIYSDAYSEAELAAMGFNEAQIANFKDLAKTAKEATTEVKTFTQLFDVLKETAQSGWTQTWEIIFGDFNTAKKTFTELQVYFSNILNDFADARNMLFGGAFNLKNPWSRIWEKLENSSIGKVVNTFDKVSDSIEDAATNLDYFQKIVNDVWRGDYKNADTGRYELLEAAGYNHKVIQDLVNKGCDYKLTIEDVEASHEKFGLTLGKNSEAMNEAANATDVATVKFKEITDEQLRQAGLTEHEIKLYRDLADEAERTGVTMLHLVNEMSENDGRTMLIDSFKNAWSGLESVIIAVKDAWVDIFPPMTVVQLYNIIKGIKEFSEYLVVHEETAKKLTRTFKGLFAIIDILLTLVSIPTKIAFKALTQLLGVLNVDILSLTAGIGDAIVEFRDWIDASLDFTKVFEMIVPPIQKAIKSFTDWIDKLKESENLPKDIADGITKWFGKTIGTVTGWFSNLSSQLQNGFTFASDNIVIGLVNGLWNGLKTAGQVIVELGRTLITKFCETVEVNSPSLVFFAIGGFIVAGLLLGIKAAFPEVWSTISDYALKCVDTIKDIDFGSIFSALLSSTASIAVLKFADAMQNFSQTFDGFGEMLEDVGKGVKSALRGMGASLRAQAVKDIAISIAILAGSLALLAFIPRDKLIAATVAIAVLGVVLGGLFATLSMTTKGSFGKESFSKIGALILTMIGLAAALVILSQSIKVLADIDFVNNWKSILLGMATIVGTIGLMMFELSIASKFMTGVDFAKMSISIVAISGLIYVMALAMKIFGGLDAGAFTKALAFVAAFGVIVASLVALSHKNHNMKIAQTGSLIQRVGVAMLLMATTCKIIATMTWGELGKAAVGLLAFTAIVAALVAMTKLATNRDVMAAGRVITAVSAAMLLMVAAGKIINSMTWSELGKALVGITVLSAIVVGLVAATKLASDREFRRTGRTILMVAGAVGMLALVATIIGHISLPVLAKGITAVTILGLMMTAMIYATSRARKCVGNLVAMTTAITLMATAVAALSFIDTRKLLVSTGVLVALMGMFTAMMATTKIVDAKALGPLIVLTVLVGVFGTIVYGLSKIKDTDKAMEATRALVVLMGAMTALLAATAGIGAIYKSVRAWGLAGIGALTLMVVPLIAFAHSMKLFDAGDLANKEKDILILVGVMAAMSALLLITAGIGAIYMATYGIAATGIAGLLLMAVPLWAFMEALIKLPFNEIASKEKDILILVGVMAAMSALMVIATVFGPFATVGVIALTEMSLFIVAFGALATAIGELFEKKPELQRFVETGIPILEQLAYGLGSVVGKFASGLFSNLPEIGTYLTEFIENAEGFIAGVKMVDKEFVSNVWSLIGAFSALSYLDSMSAIKSLLYGGKSSFKSLSDGLSELGKVIIGFSTDMGSFTDDQLNAVKRGAEAIKAIAKAAAEIPNTGFSISSIFVGHNDIDDFMTMIAGDENNHGIAYFINRLQGIRYDENAFKFIKKIPGILKSFAEAADAIPNEGFLDALFVGRNNIDDFMTMIVGDENNHGIAYFMNRLMGIDFNDDAIKNVGKLPKILTAFTEAASEIPNTGFSISSIFAGHNDIDDFMTMIVGDENNHGIAYFINRLQGIDFNGDAIKNIEKLPGILKSFAEAADAIPNSFGLVSAFTGDNSIDDFTYMLIGKDSKTGIKALIDSLKTIDINDDDIAKIEKLPGVIESIAKITEALPHAGKGGSFLSPLTSELSRLISSAVDTSQTAYLIFFVKFMSDLANEFANFIDNIPSDTSKVDTFVAQIKELIDLCDSISRDTTKHISSFSKSLNTIAKVGIADFINTISSDASVDGAKQAVDTFINKVVKRIDAKTIKKKFSKIGKYIVQGIAAGIDENSYLVSNAVRTAIDDALLAAQDEAEIHSPSLVFNEKVGRYIIQGIAEGITEDTSAEEALKIKMGNLYSAYLDLKKNWKGESPLPNFFDFAMKNGLIRVTKTMEEEAKAAGMAVEEYVEHLHADSYLYVQNGKPVPKKSAIEAITDKFKPELDALEAKKKKSESNYKWSKLSSTFGLSDSVENEKKYLQEQIDYNNQQLKVYENQIKAYGAATDTQTDEVIANIRAKMVALKEENAEYQSRINTAAVDQASELAQKITEEAKKVTDPLKRALEMADLRYENWQIEYPNAKESVKHFKLIEHLNEELVILKKIEKNALDEYNKISGTVAHDSEEYKNAYEKWVQSKVDIFNKNEEITNAEKQRLDDLEAADDRVRETEYDLWVSRNKDASEQTKLARELQYLNESLVDAEEECLKLETEYRKLVEKEGNEAEATKNALSAWNESSKKVADLRNSIADNTKATEEDVKKNLEDAEAASDRVRETEYALWVAKNQDASDIKKLTQNLAKIEEDILDAHEDIVTAQEEYDKLLADENADATKRNNALADLNEKLAIEARLLNDKKDIEETMLDLAEEEKSIAYDLAKTKYDIWANTRGRDATDEEKEIKQLEYLNEQLIIQNQITNKALGEYDEATIKHGEDSIEAARAAQAYWEERRSLSELQSKVLDIEESAADRQKRLQDKQVLAQTEYEDYIRHYEKYYLANGMTKADLEKDAKLVSGYDPNKIVKNITSKTKSALESVTTSTGYQSILTGFTDMGSSYVRAMNNGITDKSKEIQTTVSEIAVECAHKLVEARPWWISAGKQLVNGLIVGIQNKRSAAIKAVFQMGLDMIAAAKRSMDMHSPSKAFAEIGKYAVFGLVQGLVENTSLSNEAASRMGESAIENLKSSIRKISDVINSDLDTQPTIRPVLDLSNVRSGTARLSAMVSNAQAVAISSSRQARERSDENQNGNAESTTTGNTYQFTQNNYSPKALSRTEIYRQTKNQFAAMKEVLA